VQCAGLAVYSVLLDQGREAFNYRKRLLQQQYARKLEAARSCLHLGNCVQVMAVA